MKRILLTVLIFISGISCAQLQRRLSDPLETLVRRGSCIGIDIPPITLTPARTAAERQLIGENREIEKDGWLVASAQNSAIPETQTETGATVAEARRLYRELSVLDFYTEPMRDYMSSGILGENREGKLELLPESFWLNVRRSSQDSINAAKVASEINRSRAWIFSYFQNLESKNTKPDPESVERRYKKSYRDRARIGEWIQEDSGRWIRVR